MNKKSMILLYPIILGTLVALTIYYMADIRYDFNKEVAYIGEVSMEVLKSMWEGEKTLLYIDQSGKIALKQAVYDMAQEGGGENDCGVFAGQNSWNDGTNTCFPDFKNNLKSFMNNAMNKFLIEFNLRDNYLFSITQNGKLKIIGQSIGFVIFETRVKKKEIEIIPSYEIPKNAEEVIKKIIQVYGDFVNGEIEKNNPKPEASLVFAVIAQESKGDSNAISPTGCKGLLQFCSGAAIDYKLCDKNGCKIRDDRLDAKRSIIAGTKYLSNLLEDFEDYNYKEEFAVASYNGGKDLIEKAIKKTNKDNPSWQDVAKEINEVLIRESYCKKGCSQYFDQVSEREAKKGEIVNYVSKVMGYKRMQQENLITASVINLPSKKVGSFGTYTVKPNFKAEIDYDLNEYTLIRDKIDEFIGTCGDDIECVIDEAKKDNTFTWVVKYNNKVSDKEKWKSCEDEAEQVINDFVGFYQNCEGSFDDNCYCEFNLDYDEDYEVEIKKPFKYEFRINKPEDKNYILTFSPKLNPWIPSQYQIKDSKFRLTFYDQLSGKTYVLSYTNKLYIYKNDRLRFGKKWDEDTLIFANGDKKEISNLKQCMPNRDLVFCAIQKKKGYFVNDEINDKIALKNIAYRLAYTIPDNIPPAKTQGIEIENIPKSEDKVKINWDLNKEKDVKQYNIYYSKDPFSIIDKEKLFNPINLSSKTTEIILQKLGGYDENEHMNKYYFTVIAVDFYGNFEKDVKGIEFDVEDSLAPKKVDFNAFKDNGILVSWDSVKENEDGSELKDLVGYNIYWIKGVGSNFVLIDKGVNSYRIENIEAGNYEVGVTSVDEFNELKDITKIVVTI